MISFEEAKKRVEENVCNERVEERCLSDALGFVLAEDVYSQLNVPPFPQSAMDGYAINYNDLLKFDKLDIVEVISAGTLPQKKIKSGETSRIFTGAALPEDADTVVMQEKCNVENGQLSIQVTPIFQGENVRAVGSHILKNKCVASKNTFLNSGVIALLSTIGITSVKVFTVPEIGILVTGSELVTPGEKLLGGQVYESNSVLIKSILKEGGIDVYKVKFAKDNLREHIEAIKDLMRSVDVLIISGGISVGDFDFVQTALLELGVEQKFYKVAQKPGKPIYFGKLGDQLVFALPGNPASVFCCMYEYVVPAIRKWRHQTFNFQRAISFQPLLKEYEKKGNLTNILRGSISKSGVSIHADQASYKLTNLVDCNCLIVASTEFNTMEKGKMLEVHDVQMVWL